MKVCWVRVMNVKGKIAKISGPVVVAQDLNAKMYDVVYVGKTHLVGEVVKIVGSKYYIQVYEDTTGLMPGEDVISTNEPLSVVLGPGMLSSIYDGIQRPLPGIYEELNSIFVGKGIMPKPLPNKEWEFIPSVNVNDRVSQGDVIGEIRETKAIVHRVLSPFNGRIRYIEEGKFQTYEKIGEIMLFGGKKADLYMYQRWPVRKPRPYQQKYPPNIPLVTGMRVIDTFFPIAKGGTAAIPGPFGSGKTVTQHSIAKWSDTDIVIYVGCGERGNEMADVLSEFSKLKDPKTGRPMIERTVLIANTSNMPVAAREASIYTGITIAEYYRDMGYNVALMADSTSRWAEALREISSRLEEMPGEEGYPTYLSRKIAEFYERAGRVKTLSGNEGSVSIIGAVSPPGGDLSDPVVQSTLRVVKVFLGLDADLAHKRHFPAINWLISYSGYKEALDSFYINNVSEDFPYIRDTAMSILTEEAKLQEVVQLVGPDALPDRERLTLFIARMIREDFLQQNAFYEIDAHTSLRKQFLMLKTIILIYNLGLKAIAKGIRFRDISTFNLDLITRMKEIPEGSLDKFNEIETSIESFFSSLFNKQSSESAIKEG